MRTFILPAALALAFVSCGGGDDAASGSDSGSAPKTAESGNTEAAAAETPKASGPATAWDASKGTAHVTGSVAFKGDHPKVRKVDMGSDAACSAANAEPQMDESITISGDNKLQNVFVYVKKGLESWTFPVPSEPVVLTQEGCVYKPHMVGIQVGQTLTIKNADDVTHNIHSFSKRNTGFNMSQGSGSEDNVTFKKDEVLITVKCDIHGWMSTYVGCTDTPFFSISAADGSFDLGKLPPGTYTIEARHEVLGKHKQEITVGDGESKAIEFTFSE